VVTAVRGQAYNVHLTYEDYKVCPEDGQRYEIIEGDLAVSPTPILWHQELVVRLFLIFRKWSEGGAGGMVVVAPATVILAFDTVVEPDVFWISPQQVDDIAKDVVHGAPDLVVEVLSPSTGDRDRGIKARTYARYGVREYWLVDPATETVSILALRGRGFRVHAKGSGQRALASSLDPKLTVVPAELFRRS
jgi:Uma2 family endonuclease